MSRTGFALILFLLTPGFITAQTVNREVNHQHQPWYDFTETIKVHPRWGVVLNLSERHSISPLQQSQTLARAYFLHHFNPNWSAGAGFVHFWTWDGALAVPELRPEQWIFCRQKFDKIKILQLLHRYKVEERFIRNSESGKLTNGYAFNMRFRYRAGIELTLFTTGKAENPFKLLVSDEVMLNAGKNIVYNVFDQNRATAGFAYRPIEMLTLSLSYMHLWRQKSTGKSFDDIHTLRFMIEHEFTIKRKKETHG